MLGIAAGLIGGFLEELGWTGFAIPKLRRRYSVLTTGLILGSLWEAWHFLINFWSSGDSSGALSVDLLLHSLFFSVGILPAYRVLMVWVYDHTGSLLVAILMHTSLIISNVILVPMGTGEHLVTWSLVLAAALWGVVAAVAVANRGQLSRRPLQRGAM
ncbi:MAG: CPBP family intramembrane metalloprotease [Bacillota bacterium]|nr:CPBP family intramembrane metalloprotease [Bacillota bacterium]